MGLYDSRCHCQRICGISLFVSNRRSRGEEEGNHKRATQIGKIPLRGWMIVEHCLFLSSILDGERARESERARERERGRVYSLHKGPPFLPPSHSVWNCDNQRNLGTVSQSRDVLEFVWTQILIDGHSFTEWEHLVPVTEGNRWVTQRDLIITQTKASLLGHFALMFLTFISMVWLEKANFNQVKITMPSNGIITIMAPIKKRSSSIVS